MKYIIFKRENLINEIKLVIGQGFVPPSWQSNHKDDSNPYYPCYKASVVESDVVAEMFR